MLVKDYPFIKTSPGDFARPYLPITIVNPAKKVELNVYALVDTGAYDCVLPASFARPLGHVLDQGVKKTISTGAGQTEVYSHSVRIKVFDFSTRVVKVDFFQNLRIPILGVKSFLSNFILTIDYPRQSFSIVMPGRTAKRRT